MACLCLKRGTNGGLSSQLNYKPKSSPFENFRFQSFRFRFQSSPFEVFMKKDTFVPNSSFQTRFKRWVSFDVAGVVV